MRLIDGAEFEKIAKELIEISKLLTNEAKDIIEQIKKIEKSKIDARIIKLKKDILKFDELKSQIVMQYIILTKIDTIYLDEIKSIMTSIKEKEVNKLNNFVGDDEVLERIKYLVKKYDKKNPFQNWKSDSILKHTYYFSQYDDKEIEKIKKMVEEIAKAVVGELKVEAELKIKANSFYVSRVQDKCWFVLYPSNEEGLNHKEFAQIYMQFGNGEIKYGLGRGDNFDEIENQENFIKEIESDNIDKNSFSEIIKFYQEKVVPKFLELNKISSKDKYNSEGENKMKNKGNSLNQILYGPPGTGKTYNTINKAIEIIENWGVSNEENRKELKDKFEEYKQNGQIEFVTFHQSFGYEEFVEGIKAKTEDGQIEYSIEGGIFKKLCERASFISNFEEIYKKYIEQIRENNNQKILKTKTGKEFKISINGKNNLTLYTGENLKQQGTITKENLKNKNFEYWISYVEPIYQELKKLGLEDDKKNTKNYILIIDEINRGNISKIFGELITLIEPSKRIGADEELRVKLPYSNEEFGVPKNLYIIGTMNTADRSIAQIDTALRRRFEFVEMMPQPELLKENIDDLNLKKLLEAINARIEYLYDREHQIGHSYLMDVKNLEDLKHVFKNKIIPLLAEYFYEDWENIALILNNNGFIKEKEISEHLKSINENGKKVYEIVDFEGEREDIDWVSEFKKIYPQEQ